MKAEILKVIGQLQYEISILDIDEEKLTGVDIRTEELKDLVKKLNIDDVSNCLHENQVMRQGDGDVYHQCLDCCELLE